MTPFATRLAVWKYWHSLVAASTLTSRPAKERMSLKPKIQTGFNVIVCLWKASGIS